MNVSQDILLPVLLAALLANTAIILFLAVTTSRRRARARVSATGARLDFEPAMHANAYDDRRRPEWHAPITTVPLATDSAAALEPSPEAEIDHTGVADDGAAEGEAGDPTDDTSLAGLVGEATAALRTPALVEVPQADAAPDGRDALTGLLDQGTFGRLLGEEDARVRRYHRPATIVLFELEGLDRFVDRLGPDAAERVIPAVADTIRRLAREADRVARIGNGRFAVLLSETDEIAAINYVERVRRACDLWLEAGAIALHLIVGWAGTTGDPALPEAYRIATDRMHAERRRSARRHGFEGSATA